MRFRLEFTPFQSVGKPLPGITTHSKSFHGKDFKQWAQMCLSIIWPYLDAPNRRLWVAYAPINVTPHPPVGGIVGERRDFACRVSPWGGTFDQRRIFRIQ